MLWSSQELFSWFTLIKSLFDIWVNYLYSVQFSGLRDIESVLWTYQHPHRGPLNNLPLHTISVEKKVVKYSHHPRSNYWVPAILLTIWILWYVLVLRVGLQERSCPQRAALKLQCDETSRAWVALFFALELLWYFLSWGCFMNADMWILKKKKSEGWWCKISKARRKKVKKEFSKLRRLRSQQVANPLEEGLHLQAISSCLFVILWLKPAVTGPYRGFIYKQGLDTGLAELCGFSKANKVELGIIYH